MTLHAATLTRALQERDLYRQMVRAALDQMHAAHATIESQKRQLAELREERARYARDAFGRSE